MPFVKQRVHPLEQSSLILPKTKDVGKLDHYGGFVAIGLRNWNQVSLSTERDFHSAPNILRVGSLIWEDMLILITYRAYSYGKNNLPQKGLFCAAGMTLAGPFSLSTWKSFS